MDQPHPRTQLAALTRAPEPDVIATLLPLAQTPPELQPREQALAEWLVGVVQAAPRGLIAPILAEFGLDSDGGQALMSLAEAYLRVPDRATADALIAAKLGQAEWSDHLGGGHSKNWVRHVARALSAARKITSAETSPSVRALAAPVVRLSVGQAMRQMGRFFVLGRNIGEALDNAEALRPAVCSFDMLGEGARTREAAEEYFIRYRDAIDAVGARHADKPLMERHAISVKLSALHPRYEVAQADRCVPELIDLVQMLAERAAAHGIGLTIDAEETERLVMSLDIIAVVSRHPRLRGWDGLGMAVQAYQKRAGAVIDWAAETSRDAGRKLAVRLVKGAYWDAEIKRCQLDGLTDYPVFTRKSATEVSYLACARRMLETDNLQPAFATHNATTVATLLAWIGRRNDVEFQRLQGMGGELYRAVQEREHIRLRVYAPVGGHQDLLPYLVRRLLENGANSSFVHQAAADDAALARLMADPRQSAARHGGAPNPHILPPVAMFGAQRRNSMGLDMADQQQLAEIAAAFTRAWNTQPTAAPVINGMIKQGTEMTVRDPANVSRKVGQVIAATTADVHTAVDAAVAFHEQWSSLPVETRALCLERAADLMERDRLSLMALLVHEAGKTQADAISEVREAVDFCRYYAVSARRLMADATVLHGPTGEHNEIHLAGHGVFACISPWNFPLAIFMGQVAAALVTGNCVIAKPAPQTPLIAAAAINLLSEAGIPPGALHLLPGGAEIGRALVADPRVHGVVFTGSTAAAKHIARALAADDDRPLVALIAETGGLNTMIVDSTALPEQVVRDVLISAFQSAGQRCSALRLLCLQEEIADQVIAMLRGAIAELRVGEPEALATDVGPVIDEDARKRLAAYVADNAARVIATYEKPMPDNGHYIAPCVIALDHVEDMKREIFGPVLHVVRWRAGDLDLLIDRINQSGYGLTMGVHSRVPDTIAHIRGRAKIGNLYVNRSMIGAVVGVQPFGGEGLSGTGPKAGGPNYLLRFCVERTISTDLTAIGGNTHLLAMGSDEESSATPIA